MSRNQIQVIHPNFEIPLKLGWVCGHARVRKTWLPHIKNKVSLHHLNLPNLKVGLESFLCTNKPHPGKLEKTDGGIGAFHWVFHFQTGVSLNLISLAFLSEQRAHVLYFKILSLFQEEMTLWWHLLAATVSPQLLLMLLLLSTHWCSDCNHKARVNSSCVGMSYIKTCSLLNWSSTGASASSRPALSTSPQMGSHFICYCTSASSSTSSPTLVPRYHHALRSHLDYEPGRPCDASWALGSGCGLLGGSRSQRSGGTDWARLLTVVCEAGLFVQDVGG